MTITVRGTLDRNAEFRLTSDGHALMVLTVVTGLGFPFEIRRDFGAGPAAALVAQSRADALKRGVEVEATAGGAEPRLDHGTAGIVLRKLTSLTSAGTVLL
jgi:hypothetical protein